MNSKLPGGVSKFNFHRYSDIFISFTGAASFWNKTWETKLGEVKSKIRGMFVMGGVLADHQPSTLSASAKMLNRYSFSTMNQIYHPENSGKLFDFATEQNIPIYMITNNVSSTLMPSFLNVVALFTAAGLTGEFLRRISYRFYEDCGEKGCAARKLFDMYNAVAVTYAVNNIKNTEALQRTPAILLYNNKYAATIVSKPYGDKLTDAFHEATKSKSKQPQGGAFLGLWGLDSVATNWDEQDAKRVVDELKVKLRDKGQVPPPKKQDPDEANVRAFEEEVEVLEKMKFQVYRSKVFELSFRLGREELVVLHSEKKSNPDPAKAEPKP
jgi:hypothetical protein